MKIKCGDIKTKVSSNFTATAWREKWNVNILTNMHSPPARCKFCDQHGKALKLTIAQDFVTDTWGTWTNLTAWWTIPLADRPGIRQRSYFSVLRTLMFSLFFIIFASCGSKLSHLLFRLTLERNLIQEMREMPQLHITRQRRQALSTNKLKRLDIRHKKDWPWNVREFSATCILLKTRTTNKIQVPRTECWFVCFDVYYTQVQFWGQTDTRQKSRNTQM